MNSVALNGTGLDSLVATLADSLGAGVVLQDGGLRVLATAGDSAALVLDPGHCHATRQALRRASSLQVPVRLETGNRPVRLVVPVVAGGDLLAYLTVAAPPEGTDRVEEVQRVANAMAVELEVERRLSEILDQDEEEFFADLVAGRRPHRIIQRGSRLGFDLAAEHIPLAFILSGRGDPVSPREGLERLRELIHSWAGQEQLGSTPIVGLDDEAVIVFLPTLDRLKALTLARDALTGARRRGLYAVAGTGPVCREPEDYGAAADKAKWAARVRLIAGHTDMVASFDELGVGALLFKIDDRAHLEEFVGRWLGDLKDYDKRHQSQLTMSLRVLLETRSLRTSAESLHVHTSTLKYRVKRINEILDADCQEPETSFNLQVALRIDEILEGLR